MNHRLRWRGVIFAALLLATPAFAGLPLTPSTTYVANSTPVVKAADLNALQQYLAGIYSAIFSVKALVIDGTGGASVTGVAGTAKVSATTSGSSNTPPFTLASVPWGQIGKEQAMLGAARCIISMGAVNSCAGFNLKSAVNLGSVGAYEVKFNTAGPNVLSHTAMVIPINPFGPMFVTVTLTTITGGNYKVQFQFYDQTGTAADPGAFMIQATGG